MIQIRYIQCPLVGFQSYSKQFEPFLQKKNTFYLQLPAYVVMVLQTYAKEGYFRSSVTGRLIEPVFFMEGAPAHRLKSYKEKGLRTYLSSELDKGKAFWFFGTNALLCRLDALLQKLKLPDDIYIVDEPEICEEAPILTEIRFRPKEGKVVPIALESSSMHYSTN